MIVEMPNGEKQRVMGEGEGFRGQPEPVDGQVPTYVAANKRTEYKTPPSSLPPTAHAATHQAGGADKIKLDDLEPPDDNTDLDATGAKHGLMPKAAVTKLAGIGDGAQPNPATATSSEAAAGTVLGNRSFSPALVRLAAEACVWSANHFGASPANPDNKTAIQAAIDAAEAAGGGVVTLAPGSYICLTPLVIDSPGVWLDGGKVVTIRSTSDTQGAKVQISASDCGVRGIKFDGARTGAYAFSYGLVEVLGNATQVARVAVLDCEFINSRDYALFTSGNVIDTRVEFCLFRTFYIGLFSDNNAHGRPRRTIIHRCRFFDAWSTAAFSGAIKMKISSGTASDGHQLTNLRCSNSGEMGIELWGGMADCLVANCQVDTCTFGVSLNSTVRSTVTGCKAWNCSYCGFELAESCQFNLVEACQAIGYTTLAGTTRGGTYGFVLSGGGTRHHNRLVGCMAAGWTQDGFMVASNSHHTGLSNCDAHDCARLVQVRTCNYVKVQGGTLNAPAGAQHVVIDITDGNATGIELTGLTFQGAASADNIFLYDGGNSRTLTNLVVKGNNITAATAGSLSINFGGTINYVNAQIVDNVRKTGNSTFGPAFSPDSAPPDYMLAANQLAGVSSIRKFTIAVPAHGAARWFKIFSAVYGRTLNVMLHLKESEVVDGKHSAQTYQVCASPYGQDCNVLRLPAGYYGWGKIERVIYDNPGAGATHEIWIKTAAGSAYNLELAVSDHPDQWITSPTYLSMEPTWNANSHQSYVRNWFTAFCTRFVEAEHGLWCPSLPVYANNAAAAGAGLAVGRFYRTSTGTVMVVY